MEPLEFLAILVLETLFSAIFLLIPMFLFLLADREMCFSEKVGHTFGFSIGLALILLIPGIFISVPICLTAEGKEKAVIKALAEKGVPFIGSMMESRAPKGPDEIVIKMYRENGLEPPEPHGADEDLAFMLCFASGQIILTLIACAVLVVLAIVRCTRRSNT